MDGQEVLSFKYATHRLISLLCGLYTCQNQLCNATGLLKGLSVLRAGLAAYILALTVSAFAEG